MRVLKTVEDAKRERLVMLFGAGFLALAFSWMALGWWLGRPGEPIESALGVPVPAGSREVYTEHVAADPRAPYDAVYVSATWSVREAIDRMSDRAEHTDLDSRRFTMRDGTMVVVSPAGDVPSTHTLPIHPVTDGVPLGTRSWIVVEHGTPPTTTSTAAVPPDLES